MASEAKHQEISRQLLADIAAGKYGPGARLPSEAQLCQRFGVSRPTVARALRDLQDQGLVERRVGSGSYIRKQDPAGQRVGERQLGLLIPGLGTTEIFDVICGELAGLVRVHEYGLLWGGGAHPRQTESGSIVNAEELCEQFLQRRVRGVFFAPFEYARQKEEVNRRLAERLRDAGVAVVLLDRDLGPYPSRSEFDLVSIDHFAGGYLLTEHLLKLGSRRLVFVARPLSAPTIDARVAGAREALVAHQQPVPPDLAHVGDPEDMEFARGLISGQQLDGIICGNDYTAATLIRSLEKIKVRVPNHVRVVGFDDVKYARLLSVPLTTIHQPCRYIAVTAFRAMLDRIADPTMPPRGISLTPTLVVRESCGAFLPRRR
jgi:LacI family transcriptional regulator